MRTRRLLACLLAAAIVCLPTVHGVQTDWSQIFPAGPQPALRHYGASFTYDAANDRVIVFGGNLGGFTTNEVWVLVNATQGPQSWIQLFPGGAVPGGRANHSAVYDPNSNRLIVFGGCVGSCLPVTNNVSILANANGLGGAPMWIQPPIGGGPSPRQGFAAGYDPLSNRMIVFGGQDGSGLVNAGTTFGDVWMLSNANGLAAPQWIPVPAAGPQPPGRYLPSFAFDTGTGELIVAGGINTSNVTTNAVYVLSNALSGAGTWTNTLPNNAPVAPPPFAGVRAGYHAAQHQLLLPIGNAVSQTHDLYVLDNASSWQYVAVPAGVSRMLGTMGTVYNPNSNLLLSLFSGVLPSGLVNQLWSIAPQLNAPPAFTAPTPADGAAFTIRAGQQFLASIVAADPDNGDSVTIMVNGLPPGASSGTNGPANPVNRNIDWRPSYTQVGPHPLSFTAQDNHGASATTMFTVNVTPNTPPSFVAPTPLAPIDVLVGTPVNFTVVASDPDAGDGFTVDVNVATLPMGAGSGGSGFGNPASRDFNWVPNSGQAGAYNVEFHATDLAGATTYHTVTINVAPNNAPVFIAPTPFAPLSVFAGSQVSFTARASDPDGHSVQILVDFNTLPPGVNIGPNVGANPVERTFTWTPGANNVGTHTIGIRAQDQFFAETPHSVTIQVLPVELVSIAVTPQNASLHTGGQTFTATGTFSDGSNKVLPSGSGGQGGAPLWQALFSPNIDVTPCATPQFPANTLAGGFASQALTSQNGNVNTVWSPLTPVLNVNGTINANAVSLTLACTSGAADGSIAANWTGTRYEGTFSLGGQSGQITITGWSTKAPMPAPRFNFGAATANGKVYAIGGVSSFAVLDRVESYDPATDSWTGGLTPMPSPRSALGVGTIGNLIYAVGGSLPGDVNTGVLEAYDPVANAWITGLAPMPTPRGNVMAVSAGGKLYVLGGDDGPNNSNPLTTVEMYDPATNSWTPLPPMPSPRHFGIAGVLDNVIVVTGGDTGNPGTAPTEKYDIATGTWSAGVALPGGRIAGAGGVTNGGLFVFGGQSGSGQESNTLVYYLATPQRPEGWATLGSMPSPRSELAGAVVNDVVYGIGGFTGGMPPQPGLATLTALSTPPSGHLQTGFSGSGGLPQVQWSSSNTAVATINSFGTAQAVTPGQTTIVAASGTISCATTSTCATLTVVNNAPTVSINGGPFTKNEGGPSLFISSSSFDPDNDMLTRQWSIVSGPGQFTSPTNGFNVNYQNNDGPGFATIKLTVTDQFGASASATTTVRTDNVAPMVQIFGGNPITVMAGDPLSVGGNFNDPGADAWSATVDYGDGSGAQPLAITGTKQFSLSHTYAAGGNYQVTVSVADDDGGVGDATRTVIVLAPPTLSVTLSPNVLWPPNDKMVTIDATISASDDATVELVSITSNEPGAAEDIAGAEAGSDDRSFELRAKRLGGGAGRTYTITYSATNAAGTTTVSATVVVPHDMRR